jgi:hypothetical protein
MSRGVLVVKMGTRAHQTFWVFGAGDEDSHSPNRRWYRVGGAIINRAFGRESLRGPFAKSGHRSAAISVSLRLDAEEA